MPIDMRKLYSAPKFHQKFEHVVTPKIHMLKCWPEYWEAIASGQKTFEIRKNDRDYKVMDLLMIHEWDPQTESYIGRTISADITYITDFQQQEGYVVMGLGKVSLIPKAPEGHPLNPNFKG